MVSTFPGFPSSPPPAHHITKPVKRARIHLDAPMTPQPSSDIDADAPFPFHHKLPSRLVSGPATPSTSTVAFSSSPRRAGHALASSSPTRHVKFSAFDASPAPGEHDLTLRLGTTLIFGRHHVRPTGAAPATTTLSKAIPRAMSGLIANPGNAASLVLLSRDAPHASRVHAAVELVLPSSQNREKIMRIIAIGQNGMRVRVPGGILLGKKKGVRLAQGQFFEVGLERGHAVELDFYGCKAVVRMESGQVQGNEEEEEVLFPSSPAMKIPALASSLPPSSPPIMHADLPAGSPLDDDAKSNHSRESSPLSPVSARQSPVLAPASPSPSGSASPSRSERASSLILGDVFDGEPEAESDREDQFPHGHEADLQVKAERLEALNPSSKRGTPAPTAASAHGATSSHSTPAPAEPVKAAPAEIDRPAVIASSIVFSGSSKTSLADLVKLMLETQPHLKAHGDEHLWSIWVNEELESNPMFGKVERHGKDVSGRPLLPHYFYNPSADPDPERAKDLGGLVRPLRTAARGGQAIDWRPVGARRRRAW
ncbi:hypothetical protein IAT38_003714 [Cryptococcus sp. DSM 104549]